ncbi:MAG: phosphoglycerate mutase [Pseudomonadota bacterium]
MSDSSHLYIPFASCLAPGCGEALRTTPLPNLGKLLSRLRQAGRVTGEENSLSTPLERVLATALGMPAEDGRIAFAALDALREGLTAGNDAWAWITPCHWRVGTDFVAMDVVNDLALDEDGSRTMLDAMRPYFEEDGIALHYRSPTRWLARGEIFHALPTASLDRVEGRVIDNWLPRTAGAATLRRLQQEMQMLLYTHPVNDERIARGLLPVTSFWVSDAGALPADFTAAPQTPPRVADALREPALHEDWAAWSAAWRELDASECGRLLDKMQSGAPIQLTLGGERDAQTWTSEGSGGLMRRLGGMIAPVKTALLLESL